MSIRVRLLLSYVAMLLVPLFLMSIAFVVIVIVSIGDIKPLFKLEIGHQNPFAAIINQEADVAADIRLRHRTDPDSLLDDKLIHDYSERLDAVNMGLVVRKENDILFATPTIGEDALMDLPALGTDEEHFSGGDHYWIVNRKYDVSFSDGARGTIFILANLNFIEWFFTSFLKYIFITLLVIMVVTNGILTYFISRGIIRPLRSLKRAAGEIKEGNLAYAVRPEKRDEIGDLAIAFEEMRQRLKQSVDLQLQYEENRKMLISNISHDLKTPVTSIKGYVEGIMDGVTDTPEKMDRYVKTIYAKAVQMDRLIDELSLFSKLDMGRLLFHFEQIDLAAFVQDCVDEQLVDVEKRGMTLGLSIELVPESLPACITADRDKLKRVFVNVIENAVKYMDKDAGWIRLSVRDAGDAYAVDIADNGQGISAEALPYIFDRFYRADPARNPNTGGSGLGLAIAHQIIEEHHGTITAASKLGIGTTITITLNKHQREDKAE
jgi:signal transduction histidine kinase